MSVVSPHMQRRRLDLRHGRGRDRRRGQRQEKVVGGLSVRRSEIFRPRERAGAVGPQDAPTIVNNESSEIIRMLNSAFDAFTTVNTDYYPEELREEIDRINDLVYPNINNGVYRAGFATTQAAYEEAFRGVFDALDEIEAASVDEALPGWLTGNHRSRLAAVHHADPFRRRLCRPLQVQSAADRGLSKPIELSARSLSGAGRGRDGEHGSHQAALLCSHRKMNPTGIVPVGPDRTSPLRTTGAARAVVLVSERSLDERSDIRVFVCEVPYVAALHASYV